MSAPDKSETAVRAALHRLGARPAGHAPAAPSNDGQAVAPAPAAPAIPPRPDYAPTVALPGPRRGGAPRLPDWRDGHRPPLLPADDQDTPAAPGSDNHEDAGEDTPGPDDDTSKPAGTELRGRRLLRVLKGEHAPDGDERDDQDEETEETEETGEQDAGEGPPRKRLARWRRPPGRESTRPPFVLAAQLHGERERKSLAELVRELPPHTKWPLYAGSGLACGWYFGIPQFARDATASVAHHPGRLQDNPDAYFWGLVALAVLSLDRAVRHSFFLIAWTARGLTACLVVGALLYGNPLPH